MPSAPISSETRKSIIGAIWLTAQPILLSVIALPATVYVIRSLGPTGYGQWSIATSLIGAVTALSTLGLRPILARKAAQDPTLADEEAAYQFGLRGVLALGAGAIAIAACILLG
jgi:O-antigen/teichoic acid export membrane protein